jgi:integrase
MPLTLKETAKLLRQGVPGRHADSGGVKGLYLIITGKGSGSWQLRYQLRHKPHWMGLGPARDFTLLEARTRATRARQSLADDIDPLTLKRQQQASQAAADASIMTFKEAAEKYIQAHQKEWRSPKHGQQWRHTLAQYAFPLIGGMDVSKIGRPHVLNVLQQPVKASGKLPAGTFWEARTTTASRVRSRLELLLAWSKAAGYRTTLENPAAWSDDLKHLLPPPAKIAKTVNFAAVPYVELPALMEKLRGKSSLTVKALQFLILTAAREGEVTGAVWDEIDLEEKTWTIPAARMKGGKEHKVPLSPAAIELLRSLPTEANNNYLFIGARQPNLSASAMLRTLQRLGHSATVHGMRSAFSDWAHKQTTFNNHSIELSLAHSVGSAVEKAYRRGEMMEKRRRLMEAWGVYLNTPLTKAKTGNVTPIRGAAS